MFIVFVLFFLLCNNLYSQDNSGLDVEALKLIKNYKNATLLIIKNKKNESPILNKKIDESLLKAKLEDLKISNTGAKYAVLGGFSFTFDKDHKYFGKECVLYFSDDKYGHIKIEDDNKKKLYVAIESKFINILKDAAKNEE